MTDEAVAQVRRFNRTVSERIGALSDRYMGRDRPLGQARLLWEIGPDGCALAADAVQSATCAYLALITLVGLGLNAAFHWPWFDSLAALLAIPILVQEGRSAWKGHTCSCC